MRRRLCRIATASVAIAFLLAGCSTPRGPTAWEDLTASGRGIAQLEMDDAACELVRQRQAALGPGMYLNPHTAYFNCMEGRGWRQAQEPADTTSDYCASASVKTGDRFAGEDGRRVNVQRIIGISKRCTANYPILIQVLFE
jgi:hypothetical protein